MSTSCKGTIGRIIHGEWPRQSWKPDILVDEFIVFMMLSQFGCSAWSIRWTDWQSCLSIHWICLFGDDMLMTFLVWLQLIHLAFSRNMGSLLWTLTMLRGRPFSQYQYSKNKPASSFTVRSSWQGMRWISSQWLSRYSLCHYPSARVQWNPLWCCLPDYLGPVRGARG